MKTGFMDVVVNSIIPSHPGETAQWYATEFLQDKDNQSGAKYPVQSLANTLDKQVRNGKEPRIRRERIRGKFHYFPVTELSECTSLQEIITQIKLSNEELQHIDNLVSIDKFSNRNDAIKWLILEGINVNIEYLHKVNETINKINELKNKL
jgi:hypothetical protein